MGQAKNWTDDEKRYLEENWGTVSLKSIAKNLGRSEGSVRVMKVRLGLGAFLDNGEYVSYSQLLQAIYGINEAGSAYRNNKRFSDLPIRKKKVEKCSFKVVYLDDFWQWAEENKHLLDFSKMEENILGVEPDWVKQKRKIDSQYSRMYIIKPWTDVEDRKLDRLVREGRYTVNQLSEIFHRREQAIKRRIYDLCIDTKLKRNKHKDWTNEETQILIFMREEGYSFEIIGKRLNRSASSCRGKVERLNNPEYFYRENRRKKKENVRESDIHKRSYHWNERLSG